MTPTPTPDPTLLALAARVEALPQALADVGELAARDIARTQTDFLGRMAQSLCEFEGICDDAPDGDFSAEQIDAAEDALAGLAGLAVAQLVMVRALRSTTKGSSDVDE